MHEQTTRRLDIDDVCFAACVGAIVGLTSSMAADGMGLAAVKVFLYTLGFTAMSLLAIVYFLVLLRKVRT